MSGWDLTCPTYRLKAGYAKRHKPVANPQDYWPSTWVKPFWPTATPWPGETTSIANKSRVVRRPVAFHVTPPSSDCNAIPLAPTHQNSAESGDETAFRLSEVPDSTRAQGPPPALLRIVPPSPTAIIEPALSTARPSSALVTPDVAWVHVRPPSVVDSTSPPSPTIQPLRGEMNRTDQRSSDRSVLMMSQVCPPLLVRSTNPPPPATQPRRSSIKYIELRISASRSTRCDFQVVPPSSVLSILPPCPATHPTEALAKCTDASISNTRDTGRQVPAPSVVLYITPPATPGSISPTAHPTMESII